MISRKDVGEALLEGFKEALQARFATIAADAGPDNTKDTAERLHNALRQLKDTYDLACHVADGVFS